MTEPKSIFRAVLEAMVESRTRQTERRLEQYRNTIDTYANHLQSR